MSHPTTRILAMLELLQASHRLGGAEMARQLGVDERTVRRYTARLAGLGIPVVAERGRYGGYHLIPAYKLPGAGMSPDTSSLAAVPYAHEVEVLLATTMEAARRRLPPSTGTLSEDGDGVLLRARAEHLPGVAVMLAGLGWPFTVREPAALRDEVRALAGRLRDWSA